MCNCNQQNRSISKQPNISEELYHQNTASGTKIPTGNINNKTTFYKHGDPSTKEREVKVYADPLFGYILSVPGNILQNEVEEIDSEVFLPDKRGPVIDTLTVPHRWICRLEIDFGNDPGRPGQRLLGIGSGILIGSKHVLTAGHNLYNVFKKKHGEYPMEARSIKVTPAYNCGGKIKAPFGHSYSAKINYHNFWKRGIDNIRFRSAGIEYDFGLITLKSELGTKRHAALGGNPLGYWGHKTLGENTRIVPQKPEILKNRSFNISGYPIDKCCFRQIILDASNPTPLKACETYLLSRGFKGNIAQFVGGSQFSSYGNISDPSPTSAPKMIFYNLDTFKGHSGAPLWTRWEQYRNLTAIHTRGARDIDSHLAGKANAGVRITDEVLRQVQRWL